MITLIIHGMLPNLNDYTNACRLNRFAGAEMKKDAERIITTCIRTQLRDAQFYTPVKLHFRWYEPNKRRDLDNICFAKKFILDALVKNQIIENDGWKHVKGFTDEFFVDKNCPRIEVDIEGAD